MVECLKKLCACPQRKLDKTTGFFEVVFQVTLFGVVPMFGFLPLIIILSAEVLNQPYNSKAYRAAEWLGCDALSHTFYDLDR